MIINQNNISTLDRINELLKHTYQFDCFVGYFHVSGFHQVYRSLERAEKIRLLIGIATGDETYQLIQKAKQNIQDTLNKNLELEFRSLIQNNKTDKGIQTFIQWIQNGKLEIRAYPKANAHAKLYIFNFTDFATDSGRIITGSSNLTYSALNRNIEMDVELHDDFNLQNARTIFEKYWEQSIEINENFVDSIHKKTWFNVELTPYSFYLKVIYEIFNHNNKYDFFQEYQIVLQTIEQAHPELFAKIQSLSCQLRIAKKSPVIHYQGYVLTAFITSYNETMRFVMTSNDSSSREISFTEAMTLIQCESTEEKINLPSDYYPLLEKNKEHLQYLLYTEQNLNFKALNSEYALNETLLFISHIIQQMLNQNPLIKQQDFLFFEQFLAEITTKEHLLTQPLQQFKEILNQSIQKNTFFLNKIDDMIQLIQSLFDFKVKTDHVQTQNPLEYKVLLSLYLM